MSLTSWFVFWLCCASELVSSWSVLLFGQHYLIPFSLPTPTPLRFDSSSHQDDPEPWPCTACSFHPLFQPLLDRQAFPRLSTSLIRVSDNAGLMSVPCGAADLPAGLHGAIS